MFRYLEVNFQYLDKIFSLGLLPSDLFYALSELPTFAPTSPPAGGYKGLRLTGEEQGSFFPFDFRLETARR